MKFPSAVLKPRKRLAHLGAHSLTIFLIELKMAQCPEYERLHAEVENVLGNLAQVSTILVELFRSNNLDAVHRLDKQLELTLGEKERCIGAFDQHVKDHKCASVPPEGQTMGAMVETTDFSPKG
jgi:hypothetical protein